MPESTNALYQALVDRLETLTGQTVGSLEGASNYRLLSYSLLLLNALGTGVQPTEDTSAPPVEPDPLPEIPPEDANLEAPVVDPVVIADDYELDPYAYSPANKPRLSAVGTVNYFPTALVNDLTVQPRYLGMRFSPAETRVYRRFEVPLRRQNVAGDEKVALVFLEKVGTVWVVRYKRHMTLLKNQARIVWARQFTFAAGSTWAIGAGVREGEIKNSIFYGAANPYPAPFANTTLSIGDTPLGVPGTQAEGVTEGSGTHRCIRLYGVNLPKDVIGPLSIEDLPAGGGGGTGTTSQTASYASPFMGPDGGAVFELTLSKIALLTRLAVDYAARIQVYRTSGARAADASRAFGTAPAGFGAEGLILDEVLPRNGLLDIWLKNAIAISSETIYYCSLTNLDTSARIFNLSLSYLPLE